MVRCRQSETAIDVERCVIPRLRFGLVCVPALALAAAIALGQETRKPERSNRIDLSGLWRGGANRNVLGPASVPESVSPGAPGQLESQGPLPSPRFGQPGCNGRYRRHAKDATGDSAIRLGRQAVSLVVRQRTSGPSEPVEISV